MSRITVLVGTTLLLFGAACSDDDVVKKDTSVDLSVDTTTPDSGDASGSETIADSKPDAPKNPYQREDLKDKELSVGVVNNGGDAPNGAEKVYLDFNTNKHSGQDVIVAVGVIFWVTCPVRLKGLPVEAQGWSCDGDDTATTFCVSTTPAPKAA